MAVQNGPSHTNGASEASLLRYRPAKPLTYSQESEVQIYIEDSQYSQAVSVLNNLLNQDASISTPDAPRRACVPSPTFLAALATAIVHPMLTTKTSSAERLRASNEALHYLRAVNKVVGPVNAKFDEAFTSTIDFRSSRRASRRRQVSGDHDDDDDDDEEEHGIRSPLAGNGSLWAQTEDFCSLVGWAFNCSVCHQKRWERWMVWMEFMIDAMEADWEERLRLAEDMPEQRDELLEGAMIVQYTYVAGAEGRPARRKLMRAILTNGDEASRNEFREVWKDETKERVAKKDEAARTSRMNLDEGDYGDYDDEDEDEEMDAPQEAGRSSLRSRKATKETLDWNGPSSFDYTADKDKLQDSPKRTGNAVVDMGGMQSINLRQRLLALLAGVADSAPEIFMTLSDLLDLYTEILRPLPIDLFQTLVSSSCLPPTIKTHLHCNLFIPLTSAPLPSLAIAIPTQEELEKFFLPYPARSTSLSDNAKISLLLEQVLMQFLVEAEAIGREALEPTEAFKDKLLKGIEERKRKALGDARRKGKSAKGDEDKAREILRSSAERLKGLLAVIFDHDGDDVESQSSDLSDMPASQVEGLKDEESEDDEDMDED